MSIIENIVSLVGEYKTVEQIILFGSRNTTHARVNSDYDICIIIEDYSQKTGLINAIGGLMIDKNVVIHPYVFSRAEYVEKRSIPIYDEQIFSQGKTLYNRNSLFAF